MHIIDSIPGRTVLMEGKEYLYFSGTSYLGISRNLEFNKLLTEGLKRYGHNYSSSRKSNLQLAVFKEAEDYLTRLTGSEATLTMSSGYMAGQIVVQMLLNLQRNDFIYAPNTHPAIWRTPEDFYTGDFEEWTQNLNTLVKNCNQGKIVILSNAIDPLFCKKHTFDWINELPKDREFVVVLDDSHGLGITGKNGAGIISTLNPPDHVSLIVTGSLGKALGIPGGVVFSSKSIINKIKKSAFFGGSSPAIPAYLYAFLGAEEIYRKARLDLENNVESFEAKINGLDIFHYTPKYPVFYTPHNNLSSSLLKQDILASSFPYPTSEDELVTRIIISSLHTASDIEKLTDAITKIYEYKV